MNRLLIIVGGVILLLGVAWPVVRRLPLFRLPGDILIDRPGFKLFIPLTSMLVISIVISVVSWLLRR